MTLRQPGVPRQMWLCSSSFSRMTTEPVVDGPAPSTAVPGPADAAERLADQRRHALVLEIARGETMKFDAT